MMNRDEVAALLRSAELVKARLTERNDAARLAGRTFPDNWIIETLDATERVLRLRRRLEKLS